VTSAHGVFYFVHLLIGNSLSIETVQFRTRQNAVKCDWENDRWSCFALAVIADRRHLLLLSWEIRRTHAYSLRWLCYFSIGSELPVQTLTSERYCVITAVLVNRKWSVYTSCEPFVHRLQLPDFRCTTATQICV